MIKLLVVDDEIWIRERISKEIPWESVQTEVVGTAEDGQEAMEIYFKRVSSYDATVVAFRDWFRKNIWCYSGTGYLPADCLCNHLLSSEIYKVWKSLPCSRRKRRVGETVRNQCREDKDYNNDYCSGLLCIVRCAFVRTGYVRHLLLCKRLGNDGNFFCCNRWIEYCWRNR